MITCSVQGIRGARNIEVVIEKIAMVCGPNASGKSSYSYAVALAASQTESKNAADDVTIGEQSGTVNLNQKGKNTSLFIPKDGKQKLTGAAVTASRVAVGLESLVDYKSSKDRFKLLADTLKAKPTKDDVEVELKKDKLFTQYGTCSKCEKKVTEDKPLCEAATLVYPEIENAWRVICPPETKEVNFDNAYNTYYKARTEIKAQWREVTKENYGSDKANTWAPAGYSKKDLCETDVAKLTKEIESKERALEKLIGDAAVSQAERSKLEMNSGPVDSLFQSIADIKADIETLTNVVNANSQAVVIEDVECVHCQKKQTIIDGVSHKSGTMPIRDNDVYVKAQNDLSAANRRLKELEVTLESTRAANEALKNLPPVTDETQVNAAREAAESARNKLKAWKDFDRAALIHESCQRTESLVKLTAPDGLPGAKLASAINELNMELRTCCESAKWGTVTVEQDASVTYQNQAGRVSYEAASMSEKFRMRATLQVAMSLFDDSELLVIDAFDILDSGEGGRAGLLSMIYDACKRALVTCTLDAFEEMPDLESSGYGNCYWVEGGKLRGHVESKDLHTLKAEKENAPHQAVAKT